MLRKLRQRKFGKEMPVILLTNLADTDEVNKAMELNVFDYLVKSNWDIEDVIKKVKTKLGI
jgi:response regulator RpfG family c-di-GMP phosphodiesterase